MEFDEKLKQERNKILSTFFDQWLEAERAKCDKIRDEITKLREQRDNCILKLAREEFPDKKINSMRDVDWIVQTENEGFYKSAYGYYSQGKSVSSLNEQITAKQNELDPRECDLNKAKKFDNGVEFLSKVDEADQLESEVNQAESEFSNLQKRLKSVKDAAVYEKTCYIKNKNSYDKLLKEFEESHKEVA